MAPASAVCFWQTTYSSTRRVFHGISIYRPNFRFLPHPRELKQITARQWSPSHLLTPNRPGSQRIQHMPSTQGDGWPTIPRGARSLGRDFQTPLVTPPLARQLLCPSPTRYNSRHFALHLAWRVFIAPCGFSAWFAVFRVVHSAETLLIPGIFEHSTSLPIRGATSLFHASWQASDARPASPTTPQFQGAQVHLSTRHSRFHIPSLNAHKNISLPRCFTDRVCRSSAQMLLVQAPAPASRIPHPIRLGTPEITRDSWVG